MSDPVSLAEVSLPLEPSLQLVRLPVEKPQAAVSFLHARSNGVMDLIAHFWERLPQTPPLNRGDLHLIVATGGETNGKQIDISTLNMKSVSGAMLYVPKAHRADVLALDAPTAAAFAGYISYHGLKSVKPDNVATVTEPPSTSTEPNGEVSATKNMGANGGNTGGIGIGNGGVNGAGKVPIDFLTGHAEGIGWMVPLLLPMVGKRSPARQLVNSVMQLPAGVNCDSDTNVRVARESDVPLLNRWRRQYKEERGILFDADLDAWVETGRVFVYEVDKQVVSVAKFDLELPRLIEIGGVYTFPEYRTRGFGARIVSDLACRIRAIGKVPTLQVDEQNTPALKLYEGAGWREMGKLGRVWLTG